MKPNLRLTVVASLLFVSTLSFAQNAIELPVLKTNPATSSAPMSTNADTPAKIETKGKGDEVVKKSTNSVKKKTVRKKIVKKPLKNSPKEINMVSQNNIIEEKPSFVEYYDYKNMRIIPQIISTEKKSGWNFNKVSPKLVFNAVDNQGSPYPAENLIFTNESNFTVVQMNTDLSKVSETQLSTGITFDPLFTQDNCQAIFLKYQLKGNKQYTISRFFLNNEGQIENTLPPTCKVTTKDERDSTDYSSKSYISDVSFTKIVSTHTQPFEFIFHLVKNGKDYFGQNIKGYVVSNNFDDIYFPNIVPHRKGPYFGTTFISAPPKPGFYNVIIPFDVDEGKQVVRVTRTVQ